MFKLGYIDYLNCYPFYYNLFEKEAVSDVEIVPAYPEQLNVLMTRGQLDMSPVSAATYASVRDEIVILPDFCLSSVGYVKSVVLRGSVPIEELDGKTVGLTSASRTSVVLLKIILEKYYGIQPVYKQVDANPDLSTIDAALVIGNEALLKESTPVPYSYDLGDLWFRKTGHAVVFALFAARKSAVAAFKQTIDEIISSYKKSLSFFKKNPDEVIKQACKRYPDVIYDIHDYYKVLRFEFSDELKAALRFYFDEAYSLGFLDEVPDIVYL